MESLPGIFYLGFFVSCARFWLGLWECGSSEPFFPQLWHGKLLSLWRKWSNLAVSAVCVLSSSRWFAGPTVYWLLSFTLVWKDSLVFYSWQNFLIFVLPSISYQKDWVSLYLSQNHCEVEKRALHMLWLGGTQAVLSYWLPNYIFLLAGWFQSLRKKS